MFCACVEASQRSSAVQRPIHAGHLDAGDISVLAHTPCTCICSSCSCVYPAPMGSRRLLQLYLALANGKLSEVYRPCFRAMQQRQARKGALLGGKQTLDRTPGKILKDCTRRSFLLGALEACFHPVFKAISGCSHVRNDQMQPSQKGNSSSTGVSAKP